MPDKWKLPIDRIVCFGDSDESDTEVTRWFSIPVPRNRRVFVVTSERAGGIHSACSSELLRASQRALPLGTLTYVGGGGGGGVGLVETIGSWLVRDGGEGVSLGLVCRR